MAAFFYSKFVDTIEKEPIYHKKINEWYTDWSITTPIALVLILAFLYNNKQGPLPISQYGVVLVLNFGMLAMGYLGEINVFDGICEYNWFRFLRWFIRYIYNTFLKNRYNFDNTLLYSAFLGLWTIYGIAYFDEINKNAIYNIRFVFKMFCRNFLWAYFTKTFSLK